MERGPMALFGALVAIGLGPALWLGVQIGSVSVTPPRPGVVQSEQKVEPPKLKGGEGAGETPDDPEVAPQPKRKQHSTPATRAPRAEKSVSPSAQPVESADPSPTEEQTTKPADDESTPPDDPSDDPPGDDGSGSGGDDNGDGGDAPAPPGYPGLAGA
jgi:hypothetical protein